MSDKKFANLHYPGMKVDPSEAAGEHLKIDDRAKAYLASQIERIGLEAQKKLLDAAVLVIGASPLGIRIAKKLFTVGIGRVGVVRDEPLSDAHDLGNDTKATSGVIGALSKWMKAETPWASYEAFSGEAIDRRIDDILRGFKIVIVTEPDADRIMGFAKAYEAIVIVTEASGSEGWFATLPSDTVCVKCAELPATDAKVVALYPTMEKLSASLVEKIITLVLGTESDAAFESVDGKTRSLKSKQGCTKCQKK